MIVCSWVNIGFTKYVYHNHFEKRQKSAYTRSGCECSKQHAVEIANLNCIQILSQFQCLATIIIENSSIVFIHGNFHVTADLR